MTDEDGQLTVSWGWLLLGIFAVSLAIEFRADV